MRGLLMAGGKEGKDDYAVAASLIRKNLCEITPAEERLRRLVREGEEDDAVDMLRRWEKLEGGVIQPRVLSFVMDMEEVLKKRVELVKGRVPFPVKNLNMDSNEFYPQSSLYPYHVYRCSQALPQQDLSMIRQGFPTGFGVLQHPSFAAVDRVDYHQHLSMTGVNTNGPFQGVEYPQKSNAAKSYGLTNTTGQDIEQWAPRVREAAYYRSPVDSAYPPAMGFYQTQGCTEDTELAKTNTRTAKPMASSDVALYQPAPAFRPSFKLTGAPRSISSFTRRRALETEVSLDSNYAGGLSDSWIENATVEADLNCAVHVTYSDPHATLKDIFEMIIDGKIYQFSYTHPKGRYSTAAARVVFTPAEAEAFLERCNSLHGVQIGSRRIDAIPNRDKCGPAKHWEIYQSRVIRMSGPPNKSWAEEVEDKFATNIDFEPVERKEWLRGGLKIVELSFCSVLGQSCLARKCFKDWIEGSTFLGRCEIWYASDPCDPTSR